MGGHEEVWELSSRDALVTDLGLTEEGEYFSGQNYIEQKGEAGESLQ